MTAPDTPRPWYRRPGGHALLAIAVLALLAFGYNVGKDMAHRDNANAAGASAGEH